MPVHVLFLTVPVVAYALGAWSWPRVAAWVRGTPASVRAALKKVEGDLTAKVKAEEQKVLEVFHLSVTSMPVTPTPAA